MSEVTKKIAVPDDIIECATKIQNWMLANRSGKHWELMGICSRNHAHELVELQAALQDILDKSKSS